MILLCHDPFFFPSFSFPINTFLMSHTISVQLNIMLPILLSLPITYPHPKLSNFFPSAPEVFLLISRCPTPIISRGHHAIIIRTTSYLANVRGHARCYIVVVTESKRLSPVAAPSLSSSRAIHAYRRFFLPGIIWLSQFRSNSFTEIFSSPKNFFQATSLRQKDAPFPLFGFLL